MKIKICGITNVQDGLTAVFQIHTRGADAAKMKAFIRQARGE